MQQQTYDEYKKKLEKREKKKRKKKNCITLYAASMAWPASRILLVITREERDV